MKNTTCFLYLSIIVLCLFSCNKHDKIDTYNSNAKTKNTFGKRRHKGFQFSNPDSSTNAVRRFLDFGLSLKFNENGMTIRLQPTKSNFRPQICSPTLKNGDSLFVSYGQHLRIVPDKDIIYEFTNPNDENEWFQIDSIRHLLNTDEFQHTNPKAFLIQERIIGTNLVSNIDICLLLPKTFPNSQNLNAATKAFSKYNFFKITEDVGFIVIETH